MLKPNALPKAKMKDKICNSKRRVEINYEEVHKFRNSRSCNPQTIKENMAKVNHNEIQDNEIKSQVCRRKDDR